MSTKLYTYPIKSLRETPISEAVVTKHGFFYDRRFMILKVHREDDNTRRYENMHLAFFPEMVLFSTDITFPSDDGTEAGKVHVTFNPPDGGSPRTLDIPLVPDVSSLDTLKVVMHSSPTDAHNMGANYNDWFSACFGYDAVLAYLGENLRPVLMTGPSKGEPNGSWLSSITSLLGSTPEETEAITFADCAPFLVVSETSLKDVSARLPDGEQMDITKFRPNVIVEGAESKWEEDFWAEIMLGDVKLDAVQNCVRCQSINIDYSTGKPGKNEAGKVFKLMQKDRRVDSGHQYSPVFGRYCFLKPGDDHKRVAVGDEVKVLRRNSEHTVFGKLFTGM
ncbi:hypothetical protein W97_07431 [Coniosporium apollinis CBS 100218]|uniref:MOSC domain-containing protein n=1 Tax=Coniosporium apollinis (strain CBS 100218) TaxID=1168221 RepID=R7Z1L7_CONA1|nr:uncharacterized protein W97_07431 [Coniosporium apollinis CBS 100218]EON67934.1 hypothetical protein W97_07431 [Coniosporium apollinis CBS 100218]